MLEAYSKNVAISEANTSIPLNSVAVLKGNSSSLQGTASVILNKCGVYKVDVTANVTASAVGTLSVQLKKNGALVENAIAECESAADTEYNLHFSTIVQVSSNNTNCPCSIPTVIEVVCGAVATVNMFDVIIDKIV